MSDNYLRVIGQWQDTKIKTKEDLIQKLSNFSIMFAYNSGVIENEEITYHNTREIFENGKVINFTGDLKSLYAIQNQKICYEFLLDKVIAKEPIALDLIKQVHKKLTKGTYDETRWDKGERPGQFKIHDYCVANGQGALPEDVPSELQEVCDEINNFNLSADAVLTAAAYLHCKFENIHPFADGNGRTGRTLMNYFLMLSNFPPIIIYNDTKNEYYKALGNYDKTGELQMFLDYLKECLVRTWERKPVPNKKLSDFMGFS